MRRLRGFACLAATTLVVSTLASASSAQQSVRIGLAVPNYGPYAPVYVADELGYYKEAGLKAEITAYRGGSAAQEAMVAGEADIINYFPPGVALGIKKGVKAKIVGLGLAVPVGWHIMSLANSDIKSLSDLAGKKIGITAKGSTTDFFALWAGDKARVKVQTIPLGGAGLVPALKSGQIDAAVLFTPLTFRLLLSREGHSVADLAKEMRPTLPDVWVASQAFIDNHSDAVEKTLRAIYRATAYMKEHRDFSFKFLKKFTREKDDEVVKLDYEVGIKGRPTTAAIKREWLQNSLDLAKLGGITDLPSIDEIYTDKFASIKVE